jgi:hypothetical protein
LVVFRWHDIASSGIPPAESLMADLLDSIEEWLAAQAGLDDEGRTVSSEFIGTPNGGNLKGTEEAEFGRDA